RLADEHHVVLRPFRIGLLAPVEERSLAAIQAPARIEGVFAVLRQRVIERLPRLVAERLVIEQVACAEEPYDPVGADRPASARAGVLHRVQALRRVFRTYAGQL